MAPRADCELHCSTLWEIARKSRLKSPRLSGITPEAVLYRHNTHNLSFRAHSAVRAPPVPIASSAHAAATIHNGTAALAAASAAAAAVATSTASQKRGRERALSLDDLERVMGVTGPATATGSVATAGGATESYITPVFTPRAAQVGRPSAPAMSR